MLLPLLQNGCILISFLSIVHHLTRDSEILKRTSILSKSFFGIYYGALGILLMISSLQIQPGIIIDFRYIPIAISAVIGGVYQSILTSVIIATFRLVFIGISDISVNGAITAIIIGIGFGVILQLKISKRTKWILAAVYFITVVSITTWIAFVDKSIYAKVMIIYYVAYIIVTIFVVRYIRYLREIGSLYTKLKKEATKDFLTGLNNVRQFDDIFNKTVQMTLRKKEELSLLFIDIDFFKNVNDMYGHNAGDSVLKALSLILVDTCRNYDIVSRNGGEEFTVILLDCSAQKAIKIAERVRKNVEDNEFFLGHNKSIRITVSIGVATYPETSPHINDLIDNADTAVYRAKKTGRNKVVQYSEEDSRM